MASYQVPYGRGHLAVELPDDWHVEVLAPADVPGVVDPRAAVYAALDKLVGGGTLADLTGARSAAIAINDKTRPVPLGILLPPLLERLEALGLAPEAILLIIASGTHPPMRPDEYAEILPPEILARYPVCSHDAALKEDLVDLGQTSRGTPVLINGRFLAADLRIAIGDIEPHQFMGFSGGVKSAAIGLAGKLTVYKNHRMMMHPDALPLAYDHNPARQDVEEIGRMIGVQLALNAVLNEKREIVRVLAGAPLAVMAEGMPLARAVYHVSVPQALDLVIASPGGHPKDINLYQAQKALAGAAAVTREGGAIILAAACPEGSGSPTYDAWMEGMRTHAEVLERFEREGYRIGAHKAYLIAHDAVCRQVLMVADAAPETVRSWLLEPAGSLDEALRRVRKTLPSRPRVGILPAGNVTVATLAGHAGRSD